ncbi:MAG: uroporphyrinogen decarboxylase [Actinomycetota bacterium]
MTAPGDARFLRACRGEAVDAVPVWFMRQAGRSLPEYRRVRDRHPILEICRTPDLVVEVTAQPVRRLNVDAAVLFSDIVVPIQAMGIDLDIRPGVGPIIERPIRTPQDVDRLRPLDPEADVSFVLEAITALVNELDVPLIGFGGAPFTLASYLIEGGPSRTFAMTKHMMYSDPATWHKLMDRLGESVLTYLRAQAKAGAHALQLFDSWVGALAPDDFDALVAPSVQRILAGLADLDVPRIYFGVNTGPLLERIAALDPDVIGIDWRVPIDAARARLGDDVTLQGNLDPAVCLSPWPIVEERATDVLRAGAGHRHIFNLGHGVLPQTDPVVLEKIVELVHSWPQ